MCVCERMATKPELGQRKARTCVRPSFDTFSLSLLNTLILHSLDDEGKENKIIKSNTPAQDLTWIGQQQIPSHATYEDKLKVYVNNQSIIARKIRDKSIQEEDITRLNGMEQWFCAIPEPKPCREIREWRDREIQRCMGISYHCHPLLLAYIKPVITPQMESHVQAILRM